MIFAAREVSQFLSLCRTRHRHRWAVLRYFFSTGTVGTLEKSAGTFISQFFGGTFAKSVKIKKEVYPPTPFAAIV